MSFDFLIKFRVVYCRTATLGHQRLLSKKPFSFFILFKTARWQYIFQKQSGEFLHRKVAVKTLLHMSVDL